MNYYRLYFMDRESGHIVQFREFEAETDEVAIETAERWRDRDAMELWNQERKLRYWAVEPMLDE